MEIKFLKLTNFRNHKDKTVEFEKGINLIQGNNGIGKTNILEAIHLIATGKSMRAKYDRDLINYEYDFCTILAETTNSQGKEVLEMIIKKNPNFDNAAIKTAKVNKTPKSISYMTGIFNSVLFTPEDIQLITDSPSIRRHYMDSVLSQVDIQYKKSLSAYIKALRQRNKLLEMICEEHKGMDQLPFWTEQVLQRGKEIQDKRNGFFKYLMENIQSEIDTLNDSGNVEIKYLMNEMSREHLEMYAQKEVFAKSTLVGPHRDDFLINLNEHNVAEFGSRGQQRTILLALKLLEMTFIKEKTGEFPVLLLDDIFSELDEKHKEKVIETIKDKQTLITCAEEVPNLGFIEKVIGL